MSVEEAAIMGSAQGVRRDYGAAESTTGSSDFLGKVEVFLKESFNFDDPMYLFSILVTCLVVVITLFVLVLRKKSYKGNNLLFLGLSSSGKTLLFCKLILKKYKDTYVSIKENRGVFHTSDDKVTKSVNIVDLPGQENIRLKFFDQFKDSAKGVIFVLDSSTFQKEVKDVAEFLYTILVSLNGYQLPFLIACNKQDVELAKSANLIKSSLEKELSHVRHTHSAALQGVDGKSVPQVQLGNPRKEFAFSDLKNISVEFAEFSAKQDDPNSLIAIRRWIHNL